MQIFGYSNLAIMPTLCVCEKPECAFIYNGVFPLPNSYSHSDSYEMGSMIMCRTVFTEPRPIPIPIAIPMATVLNLAPILVPISWNLMNFHCNFCMGIVPSGAFVHFRGIGTGIGVGQWKRTITSVKH